MFMRYKNLGDYEALPLIKFCKHFLGSMKQAIMPFLTLLNIIVISGLLLGAFEPKYSWTDGLYSAFITSFTIGYGELTPKTSVGSVISIVLGVIGMIFLGIIIASSTNALEKTEGEIRRLRSE